MKQHLETLTEYIQIYKDCDVTQDGNTLSECAQQIASTLFFLEIERAKYHDLWQKVVYKLVLEGTPVNRAENQAHVLHPEMYQLRRIMDAAYENLNAIRSQLSWIKAGLSNQ
jgi:hypothetical protein